MNDKDADDYDKVELILTNAYLGLGFGYKVSELTEKLTKLRTDLWECMCLLKMTRRVDELKKILNKNYNELKP